MDDIIRDLDMDMDKEPATINDRGDLLDELTQENDIPVLSGTRDAPVLRSGSAAGVTFLGYLDVPEEMLSGKRRGLFGCDSSDDAAYLPTTEGMSIPSGKTAAPAPWSIALVRGGSALVLGTDGTWGTL